MGRTLANREYKDFAVLYRTHAQSRAIEETFIRFGIPYEIYGGLKFYERKEIKDILAYLRVIANASDTVSLTRIINVPKRGIGEATLAKIEVYATSQNCSMYEALSKAHEVSGLSPRFIKTLTSFSSLIEDFKAKKDTIPLTELVEHILQTTGYIAQLESEKTTEAQTRLENLREFMSVTSDFDRHSEEKTLDAFLAQIALVTDLDGYQEEQDAVILMTLHTAKGLEFPVVFVAGLEESIFPHARAQLDENELEEERRLCYVGMTRAEEKLYLTRAWQRTLYGKTVYNQPSRFLDEIPEELTSGMEKENKEKTESARISLGWGKPTFTPRETGLHFNLGDHVMHSKWGEGVIVKVEGSGENTQLSIAFPDLGIKTVMAKYAPIRKV
jgi:DNA helicase-2/ATP-dependent DNA helicase PcrA